MEGRGLCPGRQNTRYASDLATETDTDMATDGHSHRHGDGQVRIQIKLQNDDVTSGFVTKVIVIGQGFRINFN